MSDPDPTIRTAGDPGAGDDPRRPIGRPGPVRLATAGRSRQRRPHLGRNDDQGVLLEGRIGQARPRDDGHGGRAAGPAGSRTPRPPRWGSWAGSDRFANSDDPAAKIRSHLGGENPTVRAAALTALRSFPALWVERPVREAIERGLRDADARVRVASIRMALEPKSKVADPLLRKALDDPEPASRIALLDRIGAEDRLRSDLRLVGVVSGGLLAENGGVREKALQLIQKNPALLANGEIENALREIARTETSASGIGRSPGHCWRRAADRARGTARPTGSTSPSSRPRSCRSSTGWARMARTAWDATARIRS